MEVFPWEVIKQVKMDSGVEVWVRPVPPYATQDVHSELPPPPLPNVTLVGADGHEEVKPALPGSPEYEEFRKARDQHRREIAAALTNFELDYAVVKWKYPAEAESVFHTQPPKEWVPPAVLGNWGLDYKGVSRRVQFIKLAIIQTIGDQEKLEQLMLGDSAVTLKEIQAALVPTDSPEEESH